MLRRSLIFLLITVTLTIVGATGTAVLAGGLLKVAVVGFALLAVVGLLASVGRNER